MMTSRKQQTLKNVVTAFFSNVLIYVLSLFTSRIIKEKLGLDILGLNGVLGNVISILGLTELGVGTAITFALYEPLARKDRELIKSIMAFYKKTYRVIAVVVAVIGLALLPFIPSFIKSGNFTNRYIFIVYLLFLANSVLSYLMVYKRTLIVADQKNYVITIVTLIYTYVLKLSQLVAIFFTSNYILFLVVQFFCTLVYNLIINFICDKLYPFLKEKSERLSQEYLKLIEKKIKALFFHSIGTVVIYSTDNILISYFCGITEAGRYTSYLSIVNMIGTIVVIIFDNLRSSLGNFLVTESTERKKELFHHLFFLNQTMVSIFSVCLMLLLTPFIQLWFGEDTVLPNSVVFFMVLCFFIQKTLLCIGSIKSTAGLFEQDRFIPLFESLVNLVVSMILARRFGIGGIIVGTIISTIVGPFLFQPIIVYKILFIEKPLKYFKLYASYFIRFIFILLFCFFLKEKVIGVDPVNLLGFFCEAIMVFISICIMWFIFIFWKKEFRYFVNLVVNRIKK